MTTIIWATGIMVAYAIDPEIFSKAWSLEFFVLCAYAVIFDAIIIHCLERRKK